MQKVASLLLSQFLTNKHNDINYLTINIKTFWFNRHRDLANWSRAKIPSPILYYIFKYFHLKPYMKTHQKDKY